MFFLALALSDSHFFNSSLFTFFSSASSDLIEADTEELVGVVTTDETLAQLNVSYASSGIFSINAIIVYIIY
jgi:hypothetical protein